MALFKLFFCYILLLYYISSASSESAVKSSVSYNRHNNISDILQTIVSKHKDVDVFTISRREPDGNSTQLFQQLHQSWYDDYNVTFLSFHKSKVEYNTTCYELADVKEDEMHTGMITTVLYLTRGELQKNDPDSERILNEEDDVCYPKTNPKYPLWRRAVHVVIEPLSSEDDDEASVFKIGRKIVDLKPYSDVLLIWAHTEYFLKNVTFMSSLGNFTYKIALLQNSRNTTLFSYCLFCKEAEQLLLEEKLNFNKFRLTDTSEDLRGVFYPGITVTPNFYHEKSHCYSSLEDRYEVNPLCEISKKLNFTWSVNSVNPITATKLLGNPKVILPEFVTNLAFTGTSREPYRMSFTRPWTIAHFTFVHRKPRLIFYWYNFFLPFTRESWMYTIGSLIVTALFAAVISNGLTFSYRELLKSLFSVTFDLTRLQLNQCPSPPVKLAMKFISATWLFHCLVVNTGYNTKLYSFLTQPIKEIIPRTFLDLHESETFKPGGSYITFSIFVELLTDMKMVTDKDVILNIFKNKDRFKKQDIAADCLRLIKNGKDIACTDTDLYLRRISVKLFSTGSNNYFEFENDHKEMLLFSLGVWRENPLFPHIDHIVQELIESGLMDKYLYDDWEQVAQILSRRKQIKDFQNSTKKFNFKRKLLEHYGELGVRVLRLRQLRGIFLGYGCWVLLSTLCCFIENRSR